MQQGLNVIGKFLGIKQREFVNDDGTSSMTTKVGIGLPSSDGYDDQTELFELSIPKSTLTEPTFQAFQKMVNGQIVQVFFEKNSGDFNGRKYVNYRPLSVPKVLKEIEK